MSPAHPLPDAIRAYNSAVTVGLYRVGFDFRGVTYVWRFIKATSQLLIIAAGFWWGSNGQIEPSFAFAGMIVAYLGIEAVETALAFLGGEDLDVTIETDGGDEADDAVRQASLFRQSQRDDSEDKSQ